MRTRRSVAASRAGKSDWALVSSGRMGFRWKPRKFMASGAGKRAEVGKSVREHSLLRAVY